MSSSCGQPIILSVITMDLAPAASMNASTSSATPASLRISAPSENQRRRSGASASSAGTMPTVSLVALVRLGRRGRRSQRGSREVLSWLFCAAACVHAQSSVRCRTSTTLCGFATSGADALPLQNGPETVGLDGGYADSAVGLGLGGIVTFCCSLSGLAAVQGSSLIVSLPRFVRRVERSEYNTRREGNAGLCWR